MDLNTLSANWKKLQTTLKISVTDTFPSKTSSQHGVKRKRDHSQRTPRKPPVEASKPRKRLRVGKSMAQNGNNSVEKLSIKEVENDNNVQRPRLATAAALDKVNAGLSSEQVCRFAHSDQC
jgi:hypothetical protein